jgi:hypothetical protein
MQDENNRACIFLNQQGCGVHPDRPLACRLYPLARWVDADGTECFGHLTPHPKTEGIYGTSATVADYLDQRFVGAVLFLFVLVLVIRISGRHRVAHDHEGTPVDQPGGKFLGDVWGHVVAPRVWTLGDFDIVSSTSYVRKVPIVLKKSFSGDERNFLGPLMRFAHGDVRDHIVSPKNGHRPSYRR